jgi:hypothetical protein
MTDKSSISTSPAGAVERARQYAAKHGRTLTELLGSGQDGVVLKTHAKTAVKAFMHWTQYDREQGVYVHLLEKGVTSLAGFQIPRMVAFDDQLQIIELDVVQPPFVLDFAGAVLEARPDWLNQAELEEKVRDFWETSERITRVLEVLAAFRRLGVYLTDVKPGNIMLGDEHLLD